MWLDGNDLARMFGGYLDLDALSMKILSAVSRCSVSRNSAESFLENLELDQTEAGYIRTLAKSIC